MIHIDTNRIDATKKFILDEHINSIGSGDNRLFGIIFVHTLKITGSYNV